MSRLFDAWYEDSIDAGEMATREFKRAQADKVDDYLDMQDEVRMARKAITDEWAKLGGNVMAEEFSFELSDDGYVSIQKNGDLAGIIYSPYDAHRIAEIVRLHKPLLKSLETALAVVRTADSDKSPETQQFYTEANLLLEMLKAKDSKVAQP